jgi:hypothetical protein
MAIRYIRPRDLVVGQMIPRRTKSWRVGIEMVEVGRVTPIKRGERTVGYKVYSTAWLQDSSVIASDRTRQHLAPFVVMWYDQIEAEVPDALASR